MQSKREQVVVRRATANDIDWILKELKEFSAFYNTKKPLFPEVLHAKSVMLSMIDNHVVFVAERGTELLGFIGGIVTPHFFNPEIKTLAEMFWWVAKEHRGSRAGLLLLNHFISWGEVTADWITVSLETQSPVREQCLTKRGFRCTDRAYLREVV